MTTWFKRERQAIKGTRRLLASTKILVTAGFASIFILLGMVLWTAMATMKSSNQSMTALVVNTDEKTTAAYQMRDLIRLRSEQVTALRQNKYPEKRDKITGKLADLTARFNQARISLEAGEMNKDELAIWSKIGDSDQRIKDAYVATGDALFSMQDDAAKLDGTVNELQLLEFVLLKHLNDLVKLEKSIAADALEATRERYLETQTTLTALALAAIMLGIIIAVIVVSRVSKASRRIAHLANHDDLTGLRNRRSFESCLEETLRLAPRKKNKFGLLYLDLDRFKIVNDTCGHHAGDQLLTQLTEVVTQQLGKKDRMFRLGGDEFAIIANAKGFEEIVNLAETIRQSIDHFIFTYEDRDFSISMSIGVIPLTGETVNIDSLMTEVDSACYVAKESGRNRVHVAHKDDVEILRYRNNLASVEKIRSALNNEEFELFYQPVYNIREATPTLSHCEILLRIKKENGELYSPGDFIPLAEKYNLMSGIDRWVISHVIDWIEAHQSEVELPRLLVNLSALSYTDEVFLAFLVKTLEETSIDTSRIAFEITETAAVDNIEKATNFLERIGEFGCKFALDDFGTGFSTFAYLKQLPINYLKIDGSLVHNMTNDSIDREMVRAINQVGHIVGAKTIAEFVENDEIVQCLREIGVDYGQGYGLKRPEKLDALLAYLNSGESLVTRGGDQVDQAGRDFGNAA